MQNLIAPNGMNVMMYNSNDPSSVVPPTLINSYSVLTIPAYWRAIRFLAENLASFPRAVHKDGACLDVANPLDGILKSRPNNYQSSTNFWRTLFFGAQHTGNGYARIERGKAMQPIGLHNLSPGDVLPFRVDQGKGAGMEQWYYLQSTKEFLIGNDVIHLAGLSIDGMVGLDPIRLHADTFQRAKTLDKYQTRFLMRGTVLRGAIEIPGMMDAGPLAEFRQRLRTNFQGVDAQDDVILLTEGAKLNNATLTPQESQLMEQSSYSTKQIAQITGVPPAFLYDLAEGKYNNVPEQAGIDLLRYTLRTIIEQGEDELSGKLLTTADQVKGYKVRMDPSVITRGDSTTITTTLVAQTNAGLRTANEARTVLELPPDPDPKSNKLRLLGDTNPKVPLKNSVTRPTWSATTPGQWEELEADAMELDGACEAETGTAFSLNVHQGGAVGSGDAMSYFPPGTTIGTETAAGAHTFNVGAHVPHAHPNWVVPEITQTAGPILPGNPTPVHLGHIARMAAGSRIMGMAPKITVRKPAAP